MSVFTAGPEVVTNRWIARLNSLDAEIAAKNRASALLLSLIGYGYSDTSSILATEDRGVLVEWASAEKVVSAEFNPDGSFDLLSVFRDGPTDYRDNLGSADLEIAKNFIVEKLAD